MAFALECADLSDLPAGARGEDNSRNLTCPARKKCDEGAKLLEFRRRGVLAGRAARGSCRRPDREGGRGVTPGLPDALPGRSGLRTAPSLTVGPATDRHSR